MCGIVGIWAQHPIGDDIRAELGEAVRRLRHRGPDDQGIWINRSGLGLGHTRLSILDLSELGHQPMVSKDGRYVIVFNGEIYNFRQIRDRLESAGHAFAGTGDTEVILRAFAEWGSDAVRQFIGMFAIALWDEETQTLELIRDRIGVKPLYFRWDGSTLCFGSELKALRAFGHWTPQIDPASLGEFLQYGYVAGDRSIYRGVSKLRPGHRLRLTRGQSPVIEPYWSVLDALAEPLRGSDQQIEDEFEALLIDALRYRMVSDVPVGVYLSGGVDSSLVTSVLAKHYDQSIGTFTIGFSEDSHDESRWAGQVARHCGTRHTEYILDVREALKIAEDWGSLFDEPFGDSSGIPTLLVSRLAREQAKVVLSADGGDELFSGYTVYSRVLERLETLGRVPAWLARASATGISTLAPQRLDPPMLAALVPTLTRVNAVRKMNRLGGMLGDPTAGRLMDLYVSYWQPKEIAALIGSQHATRRGADSYPGTAADQISLWDFHHYLPEDILTKVDRTTMAVSIEGREPLLDHRLAEFAFRLPLHLRRGSLGPKHLLKRVLYRHVPRFLVDRPKRGFGIPLDRWLRTDLRGLVNEYLADERIRSAGLMDWKIIRQLLANFDRGDSDLAPPLWFVLAFEMWREQWG
jgi:asparagine synthase (glutamine-hydrolysing)